MQWLTLGGGTGSSDPTSVDDIFEDANNFINSGSNSTINTDVLQDTTDFLYNLFLGVGMIVAVLVGIGLGIHYMVSSVYQKADVKKSLFWYAISCGVLFAVFTIWKIAILVFSNI